MEPTHKYGSVVTLVKNGRRSNALVWDSSFHNVLDPSQPNGVNVEEHLTVGSLLPEFEIFDKSSANFARAFAPEFGVRVVEKDGEYPFPVYAFGGDTTDHTRVTADQKEMPIYLNPYPQLVQYSPDHAYKARRDESSAPKQNVYVPSETALPASVDADHKEPDTEAVEPVGHDERAAARQKFYDEHPGEELPAELKEPEPLPAA